MKKVVVIWSSPNTDGLTASAKDRVAAGLKDSGVQVEEIHLNRKKLEHCRACGDACRRASASLKTISQISSEASPRRTASYGSAPFTGGR